MHPKSHGSRAYPDLKVRIASWVYILALCEIITEMRGRAHDTMGPAVIVSVGLAIRTRMSRENRQGCVRSLYLEITTVGWGGMLLVGSSSYRLNCDSADIGTLLYVTTAFGTGLLHNFAVGSGQLATVLCVVRINVLSGRNSRVACI
jgi:hypothetical protein